jgi:transposase
MEDVIYERCAGIDVHKKMIAVCLRIGRKTEAREFGTFTQELREMTVWLKENDCEMAAMESTGSYWKPLRNVFELEGVRAMAVNAQHMKAAPGRKTDVKDAEWIAKLLSQGLLKPSFIPDREQREIRELTRFRKSQIEERARTLNRLQKMLEGANIKLSGYVSDISGRYSIELLELVLGSEKITLDDVAAHRHHNMKAGTDELLRSLTGVVTPLRRALFRAALDILRAQTEQIARIDELVRRTLNRAYNGAIAALEDIPGIGRINAEQIIAEIGIDMSRFPTAAHLCNWAGICPGNNESAGKRKSGRTNFANKTLKSTLAQRPRSAKHNKESFFYAQYQRLAVRRGKNKATVAAQRSIRIAIYHVLSGKKFNDLGSDYYTRFNKEKKINAHFKQLERLGALLSDDIRKAAVLQAVG